MESNLRYAGDGTYDSTMGYTDDRYATSATNSTASTNDDARPLTSVSGTQASTYVDAQYADPGGSADYTNTTANGGFYGYLYNWCAAMGGQGNACAYGPTSASTFDTTVSICPSGWRLPTGTANGDLYKLNQTLNSSSTASPQGLVDNFLSVYNGYYLDGLFNQGGSGGYYSSTVASAEHAYDLGFDSGIVHPGTGTSTKYYGIAVRCVI